MLEKEGKEGLRKLEGNLMMFLGRKGVIYFLFFRSRR